MRIVHINVTAAYSTGRVAVGLCRAAIAQGHRALLCHARGVCPEDVPSLRVGGKAQTYLDALLCRLTDRAGFFNKRATQKLIRQLESYQPDVVHLHNLHGYYLHLPTLFQYLKQKDMLTVWTLHDCWPFTGHCAYYSTARGAPPPEEARRRAQTEGCERWLSGCGQCPQKREYPASLLMDQSARNWREKRALFSGLAHVVLATPSEWLRGEVKRSFLNQYPVYALPNGIDTNAFQPCMDEKLMQEAVAFYGLDRADGRHAIISVASVWDERKGLDDLISLAEELGDDYRVFAVGLTQDQIASLPKNTVLGVRRTGNVRDLCALYTAAEVCVSLSRAETMGMTLVEALACGTQVLCYRAAALPEIVTDEVGKTVPLGDVAAAAEAARQLCANPLSAAACRARAEGYSAPARFAEYIKLYEAMYRHSPAYIRAVEDACAPQAGKSRPRVE